MPYFTLEHLDLARAAMVAKAHPCVVPIIALCHDSFNNSQRSVTTSQTDILNKIFRVEGSSELEWYVPLGAPRGARNEEGRWRGSVKNYVGRSLQVQTKDLRDLGVYTMELGIPRFSSSAVQTIQRFLGTKNPATETPLKVWPLAIWRYRAQDISGISEAVENFSTEFGLSLLPTLFDSSVPSEISSLTLGPQPITDTLLLSDLLEPRSTTPTEAPSASILREEPAMEHQEEEGVACILGVQANDQGELTVGGKPIQLLLHGCPGSGKSHKLSEYAKKAHYVFRTVFHPETRYTDFVGGLRPRTAWRVESPAPSFIGLDFVPPGEPRVIYEFVPGPLLQAYYLACFEPTRSVVLIIEEISRGNAAQAFGDFLQLLDRIDTTLSGVSTGSSAYSIDPRPEVRSWIIYNDIVAPSTSRGQIRLPPNLFIWATMNRADQNARQLDSAFLRRWAREHCSWKTTNTDWEDLLVRYGGANVKWGLLRMEINRRLSELSGIPEDKFIGPYFIPKSRLNEPAYLLEDLWGYLWYEVLRTRAQEFFGVATFAQLADSWANGNGAVVGQISNT
jgi:hypothetical protein